MIEQFLEQSAKLERASVIPSAELIEAIQSVLRLYGTDQDGGLTETLTPNENVDSSGPSGPFEVRIRPGSSDGDDDRVVVGENRQTIDTFTDTEGTGAPTVEDTVPKSKGRATVSPGVIITSDNVAVLTSEDVIDLWDASLIADGDESPDGYETALLYLDLSSWNGTDEIDSTFYSWAEVPLTSSFKTTLSSNSGTILPLAFVTAKNAVGDPTDTDYQPREAVHIFGMVSEPVVSLKGGGGGGDSTATLAKTTGAPTNGIYPVDLYANGKNETSTGSGILEVLNLNISEELPTGTWLIAHEVAVAVTGGSSAP